MSSEELSPEPDLSGSKFYLMNVGILSMQSSREEERERSGDA